MKIRWHYPAYVEAELNEEPETEFADQAELLALPRIRDLMATAGLFDHWEVTRNGVDRDLLLMIDKNERQWVIGELPHEHGLDFPHWKPRETGITFRQTLSDTREDVFVIEIYMDGQFRATLTPGKDGRSVHLISTHLAHEPNKHTGGDIPSYEFIFRRN